MTHPLDLEFSWHENRCLGVAPRMDCLCSSRAEKAGKLDFREDLPYSRMRPVATFLCFQLAWAVSMLLSVFRR